MRVAEVLEVMGGLGELAFLLKGAGVAEVPAFQESHPWEGA